MSRSATGSLRFLVAYVALLVAAAALPARAAGLYARLDPGEIALGEAAVLTVTLEGGGEAPRIPAVDGLSIEPQGHSTQIRIVNGQASRQTSFLYAVRPQRTGEFTLPGLEAAGAPGVPLSTGPLVLRVVSPQATPPGSAAGTPSAAGSRTARLELSFPAEPLVVGQLEPVEVRLLVPLGVEITELSAPVLSGPGFTLSPLADEQPRESQERIDGIPTLVLTWKAAVSAVKPGTHSLVVDVQGAVRVAESVRPRRGSRPGLFDDDFFGRGSLFDSFFGGRSQPLRLSAPLEVVVEALPEAGRPADFSGAVGEFSVLARTDAPRAAAGDPLTLVLDVTGRGNFDRVSVEGLESGPEFRTYPPSAHFEGIDASGVEGRKRFQQIVVPQQEGVRALPPQRFSYFDPYQRRYVTRETEPLQVAVLPAAGDAAPEAAVAAVVPDAAPEEAREALGFRSEVGVLSPPARPRFLSPSYRAALAAPLALLGVAGIVAWRRRRAGQPERAARLAADRAVRECLEALEQAFARADAEAFFDSARRALQARLGQRLSMRPEAVTLADVESRLAAEPELAASVRRILEEADAFAYAGRSRAPSSLDTMRRRVRETLTLLEVHA